MTHRILIMTLAVVALAGCAQTVPTTSAMLGAKPTLSRPPASLMTPNGY